MILSCSPSLAQVDDNEPDIRSDYSLALDAGFSLVGLRDQFGSSEREIIDKEIVGPIVSSLSPDTPYGFSFYAVDVDGDTVDDVIVTIRSPSLYASDDSYGAPTYIYLSRGSSWKLAAEGGAMSVAVRRADLGYDVAFIREVGMRVFGPNGMGEIVEK